MFIYREVSIISCQEFDFGSQYGKRCVILCALNEKEVRNSQTTMGHTD